MQDCLKIRAIRYRLQHNHKDFRLTDQSAPEPIIVIVRFYVILTPNV